MLSLPYQICHHGFQIAYRPTFSEKDFSFMTDRVKCNASQIITLKPTLTAIRSVLLLKHNKGVEHMPILSKQQYLNLKSLVKYKSYSVHHKYHSPAHITFKTYSQAKAYCIKHQLNWKSSWVLTTVNHCA